MLLLPTNAVTETTRTGFFGHSDPFIRQNLPLVQASIGHITPFVGKSRFSAGKFTPPLHARGFTLFELIIGLVLVTILLSIAIPSMRDSLQRNKVVTTTNQFVALVNLARSEALRTGRTTAICRSADPEAASPTCSATNYTGWLVYRYGNGNGGVTARAYDSSIDNAANQGGIVRVAVLPISRSGGVISNSSVIVSASTDNAAIIAFGTLGDVNAAGQQDYAVCNYGTLGEDGKGRIVTISSIGRVTVRATNVNNSGERSCFTAT